MSASPQTLELPRPQAFREAVRRGEITILTLLDALPWFAQGADWTPWRAFLCAAYGLPMTQQEYDIFVECTGRTTPPTKRASEVYGIVGRRGRKTAIEALMGVWHAAEIEYKPPIIPPGATCMIPILGKNKADAKACREYAIAILKCAGMRWLFGGEVNERITLTEPVEFVIQAASLMAGRTKAVPIALCDEVAFWNQEEAKVDGKDVIRGIRPAMASIPGGGMLVCMSSPWTETGIIGEAYGAHYGKDGDVLVWKAPTLRMHDSETVRVFIEKEYLKDPVSADAEFGANFRKIGDETYFPQYLMDELVDPDIEGRARERYNYFAFADPSGGAADSFSMAIAHYEIETIRVDGGEDEERGIAVLDFIYEKLAPFDTRTVCREVAVHLKAYGLNNVHGDHYAGDWIAGDFRDEGIMYTHVERNKSEIYLEFIPRATGHEVRLLDNARMKSQFLRLKRRATPTGRDVVDHPKGEHDDVANAVAGACVRAWEYGKGRKRPEVKQPVPTTTQELFQQEKRDLYLRQSGQRNDNSGTPRSRRRFYRGGR